MSELGSKSYYIAQQYRSHPEAAIAHLAAVVAKAVEVRRLQRARSDMATVSQRDQAERELDALLNKQVAGAVQEELF